jgi:hypothetical protein
VERSGAVFRAHKLKYALPAVLLQTGAAMVLTWIPMLAGFALGGLAGMVAGASAGIFTLYHVTSRSTYLGNERLRDALAEKLRPADGAEFVGVAETRNNRLAPAVETDDDVGFFELTDSELRLRTESNEIVIRQRDLHGIHFEIMWMHPFLQWLRVEYDDESSQRRSFLMSSRDAKTLADARRNTRKLYRRIVEWHSERQLKWLDAQRP